jgi:uncharacterized membrane protein YvbJ
MTKREKLVSELGELIELTDKSKINQIICDNFNSDELEDFIGYFKSEIGEDIDISNTSNSDDY